MPTSEKSKFGDIYLKDWLKTSSGFLFVLSNKQVQGNFQDGSELFIDTTTKVVAFLNKEGSLAIASTAKELN